MEGLLKLEAADRTDLQATARRSKKPRLPCPPWSYYRRVCGAQPLFHARTLGRQKSAVSGTWTGYAESSAQSETFFPPHMKWGKGYGARLESRKGGCGDRSAPRLARRVAVPAMASRSPARESPPTEGCTPEQGWSQSGHSQGFSASQHTEQAN